MPDKRTIKRARRDKRMGKSAGTQAGEFVRDEIRKIRRKKHGARSAKRAIAIGLSEARRAGVELKAPKKGKVSAKTRKAAVRALEKGRRHEPISPKRSKAAVEALKKESTTTVSHDALSKHAHDVAIEKTAAERSATAMKAAQTRGRQAQTGAAKGAQQVRTGRR